jgi:hypothetical protein
LEGTVVAVAADRGHRFSKPPQNQIVLVEGHGFDSAFSHPTSNAKLCCWIMPGGRTWLLSAAVEFFKN